MFQGKAVRDACISCGIKVQRIVERNQEKQYTVLRRDSLTYCRIMKGEGGIQNPNVPLVSMTVMTTVTERKFYPE